MTLTNPYSVAATENYNISEDDRFRPSLKANADRLLQRGGASNCRAHGAGAGADWRITGGHVPISRIVALLGNYLQRPVLDGTGLRQRFDIELRFTADPERP